MCVSLYACLFPFVLVGLFFLPSRWINVFVIVIIKIGQYCSLYCRQRLWQCFTASSPDAVSKYSWKNSCEFSASFYLIQTRLRQKRIESRSSNLLYCSLYATISAHCTNLSGGQTNSQTNILITVARRPRCVVEITQMQPIRPLKWNVSIAFSFIVAFFIPISRLQCMYGV